MTQQAAPAVQPNKSLYDISRDAMALEELILESGGEITPVIEEWLEEQTRALSTKADSIAYVMERMEGTATLLKARAKKYQQAAKGMDAAYERLESRIKESMTLMGTDKISGNEIEFKLQNCAKRLVIDGDAKDFALSHAELKKFSIVETVYSVDTAGLKAWMAEKNLETVDVLGEMGAKVRLEGGKSLRIKVRK